MENITGEIVFDAQRIREAKEETRQRILADKARVSEAVWPILDHVAEHLFEIEFNATALRNAEMPDGAKPRKPALGELNAKLGLSPARYIKEHRLLTAKRLLEATGIEVQDISDLVCGVTARSFSTDFKKWETEGRTPEEYRKAEGTACYEPIDWLRAWLALWLETMTPEQCEMIRAAEKAQRGSREAETELVELSVSYFSGLLERKGLAATLEVCRVMQCASRDVFEALSRHSREEGRKNRRRGAEVAEVALALVEWGIGAERADQLALGWVRLGNARRLASDLEGAEGAIREAEAWMEKAAERDRVQAEVLWLKGTLRLFQRRHGEALSAYNRAAALSRVAGAELLLVDVLFQRASLHLYRGEPREAMPDLVQAQRLLPPEDKGRRLGATLHILGAALHTDDKRRANELLHRAKQLNTEVKDPTVSLQILWFEGLLFREEGQLEAAENPLKKSRSGFIQLEDQGMTAVVSLELALLYHEQGGQAETVATYAAEALPALEALNIPEALQTAALLRQAIGEGEIPGRVLELARRRLLHPYST